MKLDVLRHTIRHKIEDGRLPRDRFSSVWGGPSAGETCDACDAVLATEQVVIEGTGLALGPVRFHVQCFQLWDAERRTSHAPAG
jgi:hypothetical protein